MDAHINRAIAIGYGGASGVPKRVLVAGFLGQTRVSLLDGVFAELRENLAAGCRNIPGQNVAIAHAGDVNVVERIVAGNRRSIYGNSVYRNFVREQNLEHIAIAGIAALLAAIADNEEDL